jgi:hypothetical protein
LGIGQRANNSCKITPCYNWTTSLEWPGNRKWDLGQGMLGVCIGQVHWKQ